MKKTISVFLALVMIFCIFTAGSGISADPAPSGEKVSMTIINGFPEIVLPARTLNYFCDKVEELSEGNIEITRYFGGTFCSLPEEFEYVATGAADMNFLLPSMAMEKMSLWNLTGNALTLEESLAVTNNIYFENEKTAPLADAQAAAANVKVLGVIPSGATLFVAKEPVTGFEDLRNTLYGCEQGIGMWQALGLPTQEVTNADAYESLSRGLITSYSTSVNLAIGSMFYEVAPYGVFSSVTNAAPFFMMNLDKWNSLTPEQQDIIKQAIALTVEWNVEQYTADEADSLKQYQELGGGEIVDMSEEDNLEYLKKAYSATYESLVPVAERGGVAEDLQTIYEETLEQLNITID